MREKALKNLNIYWNNWNNHSCRKSWCNPRGVPERVQNMARAGAGQEIRGELGGR